MKKNIFYLICVYFSFQQNIAWATENTLTANTLDLPVVSVGSEFYHAKLKLIDKVPPAKFLVTDLKQLSIDTNFPPMPLGRANFIEYINETFYFNVRNQFFSYKLSTDQWETLPSIPAVETSSSLTAYFSEITVNNNAIYIHHKERFASLYSSYLYGQNLNLGGPVEPFSGDQYYKYDIAAQQWQQVETVPIVALEETTFPEFRGAHKITIDNKFYAITDKSGDPYTSYPIAKSLHVFDPSSDEWKGRVKFPSIHNVVDNDTTIFSSQVINANNTLYAIYFNGFHFLFQEYMPELDIWTTIAERKLFPKNNLSFYDDSSSIVTIPKLKIDDSDVSMNSGEHLMQLKLTDNQNGLILSLVGFDPLKDITSSLLPKQPEAIYGHTSLVLNDEIYFFPVPEYESGGADLDSGVGKGDIGNKEVSNSPVKIYNPVIGTWSHKENIGFSYLEHTWWSSVHANLFPREYADSQFLHHDNKLYQINQDSFGSLSITDLLSGKKSSSANITAGIDFESYGATGAILNDKLYLFGGAIAGVSFSVFSFNSRVPVYDIEEDSWDLESVSSLPTPRWHLSSAVVQNKIYTFGGNLGRRYRDNKFDTFSLPFTPTDVVEIYDPNTNSWFSSTSMPTPRSIHVNVVAGNDIYILGGEDFDDEFLQRVDVYDTISNVWREARAMPFARRGFSANFVNNKIYIYGGIAKTQHKSSMPSRSFMVYDLTTDAWETEPPEIAYLTRSGLQHIKYNGEIAGTTEQGRPLNQLRVQVFNLECGVRYQVHGSNGTGWSDWLVDGQTVNFNSTPSTFIEAVKIELVNCPGWHVEYQAHIQNVSWSSWVTNGVVLGQPGQELRLEALKIRLVQE